MALDRPDFLERKASEWMNEIRWMKKSLWLKQLADLLNWESQACQHAPYLCSRLPGSLRDVIGIGLSKWPISRCMYSWSAFLIVPFPGIDWEGIDFPTERGRQQSPGDRRAIPKRSGQRRHSLITDLDPSPVLMGMTGTAFMPKPRNWTNYFKGWHPGLIKDQLGRLGRNLLTRSSDNQEHYFYKMILAIFLTIGALTSVSTRPRPNKARKSRIAWMERTKRKGQPNESANSRGQYLYYI